MKIAIIGSRGQLGNDCYTLLNDRHGVIRCDRPHVDLGSKESIDSCIAAIRPEVIINCAAYTAVDGCETEAEICWRINAEGPRHLAQAASRYRCRLLHISTDYVFDGMRPAPAGYTEDDRTNPLSMYGKSKREGEEAVLQYGEDAAILRTAWLYSAHGKNFLKTMLRLAQQDPERIVKVVNDQYGSLTWTHTLALQIVQLLGSEMQGIIHATSDGYSTWFGAARYFLDAIGVRHNLQPCTTAEYPTAARRPANSILINNKLDNAGLSVFRDWREDLRDFVRIHGKQLLHERG